MPVNPQAYQELSAMFTQKNITLVAVSKMQPASAISKLYALGHRDFGENYVQELVEKQQQLPTDIRWHFIGHLQSNKVKYIAPFVYLVHSVDSSKLLKEINKQAEKLGKTIEVLLQVHIAEEETKFGLDAAEVKDIMVEIKTGRMKHVRVKGLMGMASFTEDQEKVRKEFALLKNIYENYPELETLSMGMSGDYQIAVEEGSNMVRVGSLVFGRRS